MNGISIKTFGVISVVVALFVLAGCAGDGESSSDVAAVKPDAKDVKAEEGVGKEAAGPFVADKDLKPQATCPVMGGKVNKNVYADYEGKRVYFCCGGCDQTFKKDPEKYLKILTGRGEKVEVISK